MVEYKTGNILDEDVEALVNAVNCVGSMGKGIALQFKKSWPDNFKAYEAACRKKEVRPGGMFVFETGQLVSPRYIINFPTKRHWRDKSRIEDIDSGLNALVAEVRSREISSIAIPPLGAGLGGLAWADVRVRIERAIQNLPNVRTIVFEPHDAPGQVEPATARRAPGRRQIPSDKPFTPSDNTDGIEAQAS